MLVPLLLLSLLSAADDPAVTIYVGPQIKGGFVDVDKGVQDSIKDLKKELRWQLRRNAHYRLVDEESEADVRLYVVRRESTIGPSRVSGTITKGTGVIRSSPTQARRLETLLRTGTYEREFVSEHRSWGGVAWTIARDVLVWITANRKRLAPDS